LQELGGRLGMTAEGAALGLIRVVNATMERALRRVSVERGHDPRDFVLVPFGGAGPLHACDLADALGIRRILVPLHPGALSALGMAVADAIHDESRSLLSSLADLMADPDPLKMMIDEMVERARSVLVVGRSQEDASSMRIHAALDLRYRGQSYELTVPLELPMAETALQNAAVSFHVAHEGRYGYALQGEEVEAVTLRVRGSVPGMGAEMVSSMSIGETPSDASNKHRQSTTSKSVWLDSSGPSRIPCYERTELQQGDRFDGPALVVQLDTTTLVMPGWRVDVDEFGDMWITR